MSETSRERRRIWGHYALVVLGYTVIAVLSYWRLFAFPPAERRVFGWDCLEQFWPDLVFQWNALTNGEWPLWNPYHRGGFPYTAESFSGLYYPPQWVLMGIATLLGRMSITLMHVKVLFHLVIGATFLYAYARSRKLPALGAFLGGVVFSFSGYIVFAKDLALWTWSFLPLALLLMDRLVAKPSAYRGALLGVSVGVAALASPPVALFYLVLVSAPYLVFRALSFSEDGRTWKERVVTLLVPLLVSAAFCCGIMLIHYVPQFQIVPVSDRGDRSLDYVMIGSLPPQALVRLFLPGLVHGGAMYAGIVPLLLAIAALVAPLSDRRRDKTPLFFAAIGLLGILLACGRHLGVLERLAVFVPGFNMFRMAERYLLLLGASLAVLCAYGVGTFSRSVRLAKESPFPLRALLLCGIGYFFLLLFALIASHGPKPLWDRLISVEGVGIGLIFTVASLVTLGPCLWSNEAPSPLRSTFLLAVVLADLWSGQKNFFVIYENPREYSRDAELSRLPGSDREFRLYDEYYFEQRVGARKRVRDFYDYYIAPLTLRRYVDVMEAARRDASILRHYNVKWMIHGPHHRKGLGIHTIPTSSVVLGYERKSPEWIYEAATVAPAVAYYPGGEIVKEGTALLHLAKTAPFTKVFFEDSDLTEAERVQIAELAKQRGVTTVAGKVVSYGVNSAVTEVDAPSAGVIVFNEVYYPGWTATIDGRPAKILQANHLLRALLVEPGHHVIKWQFRPRSVLVLLPLFVLSLTVFLAWSLFLLLRKGQDR